MYAEAASLIVKMNLKRTELFGNIQTFSNEEILSTICGTGMLNAAVSVSAVLAKTGACAQDFLVSYGSCASENKTKGMFLLHSLKDQNTERTYYPDILHQTGLDEASLLTGTGVYRKDFSFTEDLYDMEGASIFHAASFFMGPHQMLFFRFVSDDGEISNLNSEVLKTISEQYVDTVIEILKGLPVSKKQQEEEDLSQLYSDLGCSETMKRELNKSIHYAQLEKIPWKEKISSYYDAGILPVKTKEEGKKIFYELRSFILDE
jgi:hypothetical protein